MMTDMMVGGFCLVIYLFLGLVFAIIREYTRGSAARSSEPDMFFAIIAFWPVMFPVMWLWALCRWVWNVGFNRNLPPANSGPGRVIDDWRKRR